MAALTQDRKTQRKQGIIFALPAAASAHIYAGAMVAADANGYVVPAADDAAHRFLGVSRREVDNTAGADGDQLVEGYLVGLFEMNATGLTQADLASNVYVVDDNTVGSGIAAQPVNVTGVALERTPLSAGGDYALAFTAAGSALSWGGGAAVDVSAGGGFTLTAADGSTVRAAVTAGSLPGADASDTVTLRHVKAGRLVEVVSASSVFVDVYGAARG